MKLLVDTSVIIDVLRGRPEATDALVAARTTAGPLHASEITRAEIIAGMRADEVSTTTALLDTFQWHDVDRDIAEAAGELGRRWLPGNRGIDTADLVIAATVLALDARLLTMNVEHFPMFDGLAASY